MLESVEGTYAIWRAESRDRPRYRRPQPARSPSLSFFRADFVREIVSLRSDAARACWMFEWMTKFCACFNAELPVSRKRRRGQRTKTPPRCANARRRASSARADPGALSSACQDSGGSEKAVVTTGYVLGRDLHQEIYQRVHKTSRKRTLCSIWGIPCH